MEPHPQGNEQGFASRTFGSPAARNRAGRLVIDNQGQHGSHWQRVLTTSAKIGFAPQTLNDRVGRARVDSCKCEGVSSEMSEQIRALERGNRALRHALLSTPRNNRAICFNDNRGKAMPGQCSLSGAGTLQPCSLAAR